MSETRVYDLPTRAFHWLFAILFIVAFTIGKSAEDESSLFPYHMLAGILLCALVFLRIIWGFLGTTHARFSDFSFAPAEVTSYIVGVLSGAKRRWAGHNPASSWAALLMMCCALGLGITGFLMSSGRAGDAAEEVHELLAHGFLALSLLHIAGVLLHSLRHKDLIWKSMITGRKSMLPKTSPEVRPHTTVGVFLCISMSLCAGYLFLNYNQATQRLQLFGTQLRLGQAGEHSHERERHRTGKHYEHEQHHDDDDD